MKKSFVLFALFFLFSCKQKTDEKKDEKNIEGQNKSSEGLSGQYKVKIDDIQTLEQLEKEGFSLSTLVFGQAQSHNQNLYKNNAYRSMADVLIDDLKKRFAQDPYMSIDMSKKHRLFAWDWLRSPYSFYELVGIFPRFDRSVFSREKNQCGEMRLIYRLAYEKIEKGEKLYSRLPLSVNLVFHLKKGADNVSDDDPDKGTEGESEESCQQSALSWLSLESKELSQLKTTLFSLQNLKSLEVNLQSVRWPSTVRPDYGGYAEYIMRVFKRDSQQKIFFPSFMENMIDVEKLKNNARLRGELLDHLKSSESIEDVDRGTISLPNKFLAKKAISVAFHGLHRKRNRPFDQIFKASDFASINFNNHQYVKSPQSFLRRLNDMTCVGCHQGRAIAGFHFVGIDKEKSFSANKVKMAMSGHLSGDLPRRRHYLKTLLRGENPEQARPFSERADVELGKYGAHCGLSGDASFKSWSCESGLTCQRIFSGDQSPVGVCLPPKNKFAGDPCEVGRIEQSADSLRDRIVSRQERACRSGQSCFLAQAGFPGGLCHEYCDDLREGESCGLIAFNGFNSCLFARKTFTSCLRKFTGRISLKSCDEENPCRDDFVCTPAENGKGACIPPYFLFQLRVDGHPKAI